MLGVATVQRTLLFPRYLVRMREHPPRPAEAESFWLEHGGQRIEVWLVPGHGVSAERPGPAVIFAHGNGELIDDWPAMLEPYRQMGVSVVLPEYRGYGRSRGTPSEHGIVRDFEAVIAALSEDPRVDTQKLVYHGRSLGGGVVCALTRRRAPAALILESTFTSVSDVALGMGMPRRLAPYLITDKFDSLPVVESFAGPVLVMHGRVDTLIPMEHAQRLAASNAQAKVVIYESGHNDLPPHISRAHYWSQIRTTITRGFTAGEAAADE
jgi:fermentation-respiration switch protein FrsA (DUF1100 family)